MLKTIQNLSNRFNMFTLKKYAIYVLDDYSVHLIPEIKEALLKCGYILVVIGGGVTGGIQVDDTDVHSPLNAKYRQLEQGLMIHQLAENPQKIPQPNRNDMMRMLDGSFRSSKIDFSSRFKVLWVTNTLDGSEDHLVLERVELMGMITPPKGVKRKFNKIPEDEVEELFDCKGDEIGAAPDKADDCASDEISNREDNVADNDHMTGKGESTGEEDTTYGEISIVVKLADVCTDNDDDELKKYAKFIDDMGALLLNYEPSNKLMPMYLNKHAA